MTLEDYIQKNYPPVLYRLEFEKYQSELPLDQVFKSGNKFWPLRDGFGGSKCRGPFLEYRGDKIWKYDLVLFRNEKDKSCVDVRDWYRYVALVPDHLDDQGIRLWKAWLWLIYCSEHAYIGGWPTRPSEDPNEWMKINLLKYF